MQRDPGRISCPEGRNEPWRRDTACCGAGRGRRDTCGPRGTEELRPFFELLPPFSPFYAPGWRFVRAPSPLPGTAYCALRRYVRDGRVRRVAYALPGTPYRPPAELPGYRYHLGYWVLEKEAE